MNAFSFTFRTLASIMLMVIVFVITKFSFTYQGMDSGPGMNFTLFGVVMAGMWIYLMIIKYRLKEDKITGGDHSLTVLLIGLTNLYFPVKAVFDMSNEDTFYSTVFAQWIKIGICVLMVMFTMTVLKLIENKNRSFMEDFTSFHWISALKDLGKGASNMAWTLYAFAATTLTALSIVSMIWSYGVFGFIGIFVELLVLFLVASYLIFVIMKKVVPKGKDKNGAVDEGTLEKSN
jgi:hypothetical protein